MKQNIIVRNYTTEDYQDIIQAGYPFGTATFGISFKLKRRLLDTAEQLKRRFLVAYSLDEKRAVGLVTLKEINSNIWGIGAIFVSPTHRGLRISSLLYKASFEFLRDREVGKAVATVETANQASIRSMKRNWDRFLSQGFYKCSGKTLDARSSWRKDFLTRYFKASDRNSLFKIYKQCTHRGWRSFLEIDIDNFLDRFIEYPCYTGLLKLLVRKEVLILKKRGQIVGYLLVAVPRSPLRRLPVRPYFFLANDLSTIEVMDFAGEMLKLMFRRGFGNIHLYFISANEQRSREIADGLRTRFELAVSQYLVAAKKL